MFFCSNGSRAVYERRFNSRVRRLESLTPEMMKSSSNGRRFSSMFKAVSDPGFEDEGSTILVPRFLFGPTDTLLVFLLLP